MSKYSLWQFGFENTSTSISHLRCLVIAKDGSKDRSEDAERTGVR
jgi:hypothetical protein